MSTNRIHNLGAVARPPAGLVALAAAVTLTSVAVGGAEATKRRAITQKVVVSHDIFARLKARPAPLGRPITASGTFTARQWTIGPSRTIGTLLEKGAVTSTSTLVGKQQSGKFRGTVRGMATATGKRGSVTWKFSAPSASIAPSTSPRHGPAAGLGPVPTVVGTGKALITDATGDLAQLKEKKGMTAFFFNEATGVLLVSALL